MCGCVRHWLIGAPCTCDCEHGPSLAVVAPDPEPDATVYVNADRTLLLTVWADGTHELALRDESRRWGAPITLKRESLEVSS